MSYKLTFSQYKEILIFFQCIASGLLGADGQNVLSLVGEDLKRKGGLKPQLPNMVEGNVMAVAIEQGRVKHNIVQVK